MMDTVVTKYGNGDAEQQNNDDRSAGRGCSRRKKTDQDACICKVDVGASTQYTSSFNQKTQKQERETQALFSFAPNFFVLESY